jgi:DNA-binding NtrC family response regulator
MQLVGKKILIVDDEPLFLQTTGRLLSKEGAECETAEDAATALGILGQRDFDLILTDLNMPGNLQWELLQAGRRRWSHVPMIVVTGVPTLPSAIESLRLGVTDYLLKPVGFPELLSSVRRALDSSGGVVTATDGSIPDPSQFHSGDAPDVEWSSTDDLSTDLEVSFQQRRAASERQFLVELMITSQGNVTQASRRANMSRQGFHKLLKRHGLSASDFREKSGGASLN